MGAQEWTEFDHRARRTWGERPDELAWRACDRSGYVREKAVHELAELGTPQALVLIALRSADWVPQVRDAARLACEWWLRQPVGLVGLAEAAYLLRRRSEGEWLARRVDETLRQNPVVLDAALGAGGVLTRRAAYRAAIETDHLALDQLRVIGKSEKDTVVRTACAIRAVWLARTSGRLDIVAEFATSRNSAIRADVVHLLARAGDISAARDALGDRSALVRATAQTAVRRAGESPAELYRAAQVSAGVLAGLGETGSAADAGRILPALEHWAARCRAEAVRALRRLGVRLPVERLLTLLTDASALVVRQVVRSLADRSFDEGPLWEMLGTGASHARTAAYRLLRERGSRTRVRTDLALLGDAQLGDRALADLRHWMSHEGVSASLSVRGDRDFEVLVADAGAILPARTHRYLRFYLGLD